MFGYTEVLQVIGAMIIFSLILMTSNSMIIRNSTMQVEGELEQETIALAQDIIEEARIKEFDANTTAPLPPTKIPSGFTSAGSLGPDGGTSEDERHEFNDFDDYNGHTETVNTEHGDFTISTEVFYVDKNTFSKVSTPTTFKKMVVTITNALLVDGSDNMKEYKFEFIRNYYAD
ncbi:hypothetical protein G3570_09905 [Balneolaceae bacterium YR4-1]|uniref:Type II secretion system protein n=1 Tax=Halalkalibaculum roseum TaxID=2709311 RepID=A0A6M1T2G1_9BACT|nr:hypothetical protein [Halalkalibaculum roseum]NGP76947.1 hypothetical protein [Halalkalibaculum roseum]